MGFVITDPYGTCSHTANGWTYSTYVALADGTPYSMTGPDGGAWYFLTPAEKELQYGPLA